MPLESNHSERVFSVSFRQDIQSESYSLVCLLPWRLRWLEAFVFSPRCPTAAHGLREYLWMQRSLCLSLAQGADARMPPSLPLAHIMNRLRSKWKLETVKT